MQLWSRLARVPGHMKALAWPEMVLTGKELPDVPWLRLAPCHLLRCHAQHLMLCMRAPVAALPS